MFKKKSAQIVNVAGNYYVYSVYDSVSKKFRGCFYHTTDEDMIRITLPTILMDFPLRDIEIHRIGKFCDDTGVIEPTPHVIIPTDCYTFPHSRLSSVGDDLPPEELEKAMQEQKSKILAEMAEKKKSASDNKTKKEA